MGLLDMLGDDQSRFALSLLAAAGPSPTPMSFGQRALGAVQQFDQFRGARDEAEARRQEREQRARQTALQEQMARFQMERAVADAEARKLAEEQRGGYLDSLSNSQGPARPFSVLDAIRAGLAPQEIGMLAPKPAERKFEKVGDALLEIPGEGAPREVYKAPDKPASLPSSVQEYQFAVGQGYKGTFDQWKKDNARAGATQIGLPKIDIKMGEGIASQVGPMLKDSRAQAESGIRLVDSANRVLQAAERGNLYAGPLANMQLKSAQVLDALGVAGATTKEKIANTRGTIRGMAEQAVSARTQLGGQAQISNTEQELLNKATSGDVAELTAAEIVQIARLNDRLGRQLYAGHERQLNVMRQRPELQNVAPFYDVPPLPSPQQDQPVLKYDLKTGRIQR